ncbi:MAG: ABC transporter permease [Pseudomonadota bacterium]
MIPIRHWIVVTVSLVGTALLFLGAFLTLPAAGEPAPGYLWVALIGAWIIAWKSVSVVAEVFDGRRAATPAAALIFGITLLLIWEIVVRGAQISPVILPPPSAIAARFAASTDILWADFLQTAKGVFAGYFIGCTVGFLAAIAIDRSPFLTRGLLPIGNLVAALPIIGVAPIMVMWYGFDWHSKAAVVIIMCFFPMLVNTVEGLQAADRMQKDLMRTYAASYGQTLMKLRLPAAAPFIFNGLKICSTLALIGAIVAEFFGTPIVGMGFRISTEVGRMNVDMVWAEIAVAAIVGSAFYGAVALIERAVTFWHPSQRG